MLYACTSCKTLIEDIEIEEHTHKLTPQYFIPIGCLGWYHSTYICPNCNCENAGYDLKTEEEFRGIKSYRLYWYDGKIEELQGYDIMDCLVRAGYELSALSNLRLFKELKEDF
jgi:hypothetical protein